MKTMEELSRSGRWLRQNPDYNKIWREANPGYIKNYNKIRYAANPDYYRRQYIEHREEYRKMHKKWYAENKEHSNQVSRNWARTHPEEIRAYYRNGRLAVLDHYSNGTTACAICGEDNVGFLTMDHIEGGGKKHLREIGRPLAFWLLHQYRKTGVWPKGFQVLCANDNSIKRFEENGYKLAPNGMTKLRSKIRSLLGDCCAICGLDDHRALHIEHLGNDGSEERKRFVGNIYAYYKHILEKAKEEISLFGYCKSYQLLCANHNLEKQMKVQIKEQTKKNKS